MKMNKKEVESFKKPSRLKAKIIDCFKDITKDSKVEIIPMSIMIGNTFTVHFKIHNKKSYLSGEVTFEPRSGYHS